MLILITYDIENDRVRTKLAHKLKDFGRRVQLSVFEADVSADELQRLTDLLEKVTLAKEDSIRLYTICSTCSGKVKIWGAGEVTEDRDFYIV